jgi:threonine dehydrogenase-like Zn-dependent dehydrogenase
VKANCWYGANKLRVEEVPDPRIINPHDAILRITSTAICGSDLRTGSSKSATAESPQLH